MRFWIPALVGPGVPCWIKSTHFELDKVKVDMLNYFLIKKGVNIRKIIVSLLILSFLISGCATLFKQKERTVPFDSDPQGATIYIDGNRDTTEVKVLLNVEKK